MSKKSEIVLSGERPEGPLYCRIFPFWEVSLTKSGKARQAMEISSAEAHALKKLHNADTVQELVAIFVDARKKGESEHFHRELVEQVFFKETTATAFVMTLAIICDEQDWRDNALQVIRDKIYDNRLSLKETFRMVDKNGDGTLSKPEFREGMLKLNIPISHGIADELFDGMDLDNNRKLTYHEFLERFQLQARSAEEKGPQLSLDDARRNEVGIDELLNNLFSIKKELVNDFCLADLDGSGTMDPAEFTRLVNVLLKPRGLVGPMGVPKRQMDHLLHLITKRNATRVQLQFLVDVLKVVDSKAKGRPNSPRRNRSMTNLVNERPGDAVKASVTISSDLSDPSSARIWFHGPPHIRKRFCGSLIGKRPAFSEGKIPGGGVTGPLVVVNPQVESLTNSIAFLGADITGMQTPINDPQDRAAAIEGLMRKISACEHLGASAVMITVEEGIITDAHQVTKSRVPVVTVGPKDGVFLSKSLPR